MKEDWTLKIVYCGMIIMSGFVVYVLAIASGVMR